ncbi:beta-ketoacyl-ACP synthase III [Jiulongibacter sediminis]|jgi:3-oxoacyl-[acyl-carrier-protein] synthase-3|uniref:Beta-ketoacyl-[acyl-carrier-protein] synthase III n=1 Tax=Jiulongibacter sediminis TaxID=1605367 RepID=A0A0P7BZE3_9BACT|nr:beta-ketoacyl-ACP synthase III [Jiulongibacter sediminis]KPM47006.1 3-oxoacyl-ACP synthase [Jiulongibacter sediminis]TBX22348.1 3-oxoacyl-ACP synthase [Jiulongibacter sediminis]
MSIKAAITGVSAYLPEDVLTNADLEKIVETNDEWITSRTGIKERRILKGEGLGTSFMAAEAVKSLLKKTNTKPEEVDLVIVATVTPDYLFPSTANLVCTQAGIPAIGSFDILAACSGFIYALSTGSQFIESGRYKKVVVVGADKMSSIIDWTDRTTCILFGDGAGAVMLEANEEGLGLQDFRMHSDGTGEDHLNMRGGGSKFPASHETVDQRLHYIRQEGQAVFKFAVTKMADTAEEIMKANNLTGDDIAYLVPHQANKRIIDATARRMGVGEDKVMLNINKYGNTTAATIPLCLFDYESKLKKGDNLILAAFGGGFTWASAYLKWAY